MCLHARVTDVMFLQSKGLDYVMCIFEYVRLQRGNEDMNIHIEGYNSEIKHSYCTECNKTGVM